jgi:sphinganine-1-phosphate aldolase
LNGQQYPNAIHMAVTRPQTQPGVVEAWTTDLAAAVAYARAKEAAGERPFTGAIYGGVAGGMTAQADAAIRLVMTDLFDGQLSLPPP